MWPSESLWGDDGGAVHARKAKSSPGAGPQLLAIASKSCKEGYGIRLYRINGKQLKINGAEFRVIISAEMTIPAYNCLLCCIGDVKNTKYAP